MSIPYLDSHSAKPSIVITCPPLLCCDEIWEEAYLRFESPEEEVSKFRNRLIRLKASAWNRNAEIVEIFCGRGNGLHALQKLGFMRLEGVDLSERLLRQFCGDATLYVADCRKLPFHDSSKDILIVQGGLHHLQTLPFDLVETLLECKRVLRTGGRMVLVEPWMTTFLKAIHFLSEIPILRARFSKLDAFATMTEREFETYYRWHSYKHVINTKLNELFKTEIRKVRFGKLYYVGSKL